MNSITNLVHHVLPYSRDVSNFSCGPQKKVEQLTFQIPPHPRVCRAKQESFNFIVIFIKNAL
jgi:hypothetical protein